LSAELFAENQPSSAYNTWAANKDDFKSQEGIGKT